jgi:hypothetical protein
MGKLFIITEFLAFLAKMFLTFIKKRISEFTNLMSDKQEKENKKGVLRQYRERKRQWRYNLLECVTSLKQTGSYPCYLSLSFAIIPYRTMSPCLKK